VIRADLGILARLAPGTRVRLLFVEPADAEAAAADLSSRLAEIAP